MLPQVNEIITAIETDEQLRWLSLTVPLKVFSDSSRFLAKLDDLAHLPLDPQALHPWPEMLVRLSRTSCGVDSVDSRAGTGMGSSLPLLATCVLRVAKKPSCRSLKLAPVWCWRWPMARLSRSWEETRTRSNSKADDVSGDLAERYGYVNRSLPDAILTGLSMACTRIASFDKQTITDTSA